MRRPWSHFPLAALLGGVGVMHFIRPEFFRPLMPPWIPWHDAMIYASGVAEVVAALALLRAGTRRFGGWLALLTLVAVWPANWHHALSGGLSDPALPPEMASAAVAWIRLPLQLPLLWWAWTLARRQPSGSVDGMPVGSQPHWKSSTNT